MSIDRKYTLAELEALPTIGDGGYTDDLKIETDDTRVWLARTSVADDENFLHRVSVEKLLDGRWFIVDEYEAE